MYLPSSALIVQLATIPHARQNLLLPPLHVRQIQSFTHIHPIFPSIPLSVVLDLPLPGLTVSPPHCDHRLMPRRLLSGPTVCLVEEHSY